MAHTHLLVENALQRRQSAAADRLEKEMKNPKNEHLCGGEKWVGQHAALAEQRSTLTSFAG